MIVLNEKSAVVYMTGDEGDLYRLKEAFEFPHPYRDRIDLYVLYKRTLHDEKGPRGWSGMVSPIKVRRGEAEFFRGYREAVVDKAAELKIEVSSSSKLLNSPFANITTDDIAGDCIAGDFELDENQREVIASWLRHGTGIGKIAVNGGKTAAFAGFAAMLKDHIDEARFLYVTDRERLTTQVDREMQKFLPGWDITKYGGNGKDNTGKDMVVCTLAMLRTHYSELVMDGWFDTFNAVMFDESHHAQSDQAEKILLAINGAFFRVGASDTAKEDDPLAKMRITGLLGPVRTVVEQVELIEAGRSAVPHIYIIDVPEWEDKFRGIPYQVECNTPAWVLLSGEETMRKGIYKGPVYETKEDGSIQMKKQRVLEGVTLTSVEVPVIRPGFHTVEIDGVDYEIDSSYCLLKRAVDKAIIQFKERNELVVEWAKYFSDQGKRTLVVATRTMHVLILEALMFDAVHEDLVRVLMGEDTKSKRDHTFDWFKQTPGAVLITPLVKEGVSINEIEAGVVADYVGDYEYANQIVGRFLRKKEGENVAEIVWFVDRQQRRFKTGCQAMLKKLSRQAKGAFVFYYPVIHPQDIESSKVFDTAAEIEFHRDRNLVFRGLEV
jgi:superfamily II DNA or RNA helicase